LIRNNFSKRHHVKIDFAKKHRDKVSKMFQIITSFKSISGASLIEELDVTPTKFYFIQRHCIDSNPISYDKKTRLYTLEVIPKITKELAEIKSGLVKVESGSGYELLEGEKEIIAAIQEETLRIEEGLRKALI